MERNFELCSQCRVRITIFGDIWGAEHKLTPHCDPKGVERPLDGKDVVGQHREGRGSKQNKQHMQKATYSSELGKNIIPYSYVQG